jgi:hypothetical protein
MLTLLLLLTVVAAAARGLWSPCGLSMLSSLNPVAERARGHRFWATAAWYLAGAIAGGAVLGAGCAAGALAVGGAALPGRARYALALAGAFVAVAADLRVGGFRLPVHPRQVDERWLSTYRRWIYAGGYGAQIGTGFATYIMTAGTYLLVVLAALTGRPAEAFAAGVLFGLLRGAAIALAGRARDPGRLADLMARVDAAAGPSVLAAAAVYTAVAAGAALRLGGPGWGVAAAGALAGGLALAGASARAGRRPLVG